MTEQNLKHHSGVSTQQDIVMLAGDNEKSASPSSRLVSTLKNNNQAHSMRMLKQIQANIVPVASTSSSTPGTLSARFGQVSNDLIRKL
jgi:hypothetical protein